MNAARHEAGHLVAIHLLGLADILRPGGAAIAGQKGIVTLAATSQPTASDLSALMARVANAAPVSTAPVVEAARQHPELVPALLTFILAGYAAESASWSGDFGRTITVRTSTDFTTAEAIIAELLPYPGWLPECPVLSAARDALDHAVEWAAQPNVRAMIDAVTGRLDASGAITWAELQTFLASVETVTPDRVSLPVDASTVESWTDSPVEAIAGKREPATAGSPRAQQTNDERNEATRK